MGKVGLDKSVSLDGYITGPNPGPGQPLGEGGDWIFAWMKPYEETSFRDNEVLGDALESTGAVIMGKPVVRDHRRRGGVGRARWDRVRMAGLRTHP